MAPRLCSALTWGLDSLVLSWHRGGLQLRAVSAGRREYSCWNFQEAVVGGRPW